MFCPFFNLDLLQYQWVVNMALFSLTQILLFSISNLQSNALTRFVRLHARISDNGLNVCFHFNVIQKQYVAPNMRTSLDFFHDLVTCCNGCSVKSTCVLSFNFAGFKFRAERHKWHFRAEINSCSFLNILYLPRNVQKSNSY